MATLNERLAFLISVNADQAIRAFDQTGKAADRGLSKAEDRLDKMSGQMTKFGAGALAAAGVAGRGLYSLAEAAGDANAAFAANEQVLGDASASVRRWAEDSVEAVGLSERAAVEATTSFGGLAKVAGMTGDDVAGFSIQMTQLAADMAAFKDVSPEQALQDLQAGFAGSTEVLRKYNIFLDDAGLKSAYFNATGQEVTGTLTAQQRVIATHQAIMEQSTDIQGQWARESDSLAANQAKLSAELDNLRANVGQGVLPVMNDLVSGLGDAAGAFGDLDPAAQSAVGTVATYATVATGAVGALSLVAGQTLKLRDRFTTLGEDGTRSLNRFGRAARTASVALGALAVIEIVDESFRAFTDTAGEAEQAVKELYNTVAEGEAAAAVVDQVAEAANRAEANMSQWDKANAKLNRSLIDVVRGVNSNRQELESFKDVLEAMLAQGDSAAAQRTIDALRETGDAAEQLGISQGELNKVLDEYQGRLETNVAYEQNQTKALDASSTAADGHADSLRDMAGAAAEAAEEINHVTLATQDLREEYGERSEYLSLMDTIDDVRESHQEANEAAASGQADAARAARAHEQDLIGLRQKVIDYGEQIEGLPAERVTDIIAAIDQGDYARVALLLDDLERERQATIRIREIRESPSYQSVTQGDRRARAAGGPVFPGHDYLVGEHGPEIVRFDGAGDVWPSGVRPPREGGTVVKRVIAEHMTVNVTNGRSWAEEMLITESLYGQGL